MKKNLLLLASCALLFSACDKDDSKECANYSDEIKLNASVKISQVKSRASLGPVNSSFNFDFPIGIYAYKGTDWSATTNLINNDAATVSGTNVTNQRHAITFGSGPYYYPSDGSTVHAFAFAPRGTESLAAGAGTSPVVDIAMSGHDDVMWASGTGYKIGSAAAVAPELNFAHKLTQLQFRFLAGVNYPANNLVKSLTVNAQPSVAHMTVGTGECTFSGSVAMEALSAASQSSGISISATPGTNANSPVMTKTVSGSGAYSLTIVVKQGNGNPDVTYVNVPIDLSAVTGESHMITLEFTEAAITATATVADWITGSGASITL